MSENDMTKRSKTDLAHFDAMADEEIDTSEIPPLTAEFFEKATWRMPSQPANPTVEKITIEIEPDTLDWFKAQGDDYQQRLAAAIRLYAAAHREIEREYQVG